MGIADARIDIEMNRCLWLKASGMMYMVSNKTARCIALKTIDQAIQAFGGAGVSGEAGLGYTSAAARCVWRMAPTKCTIAAMPDMNSEV